MVRTLALLGLVAVAAATTTAAPVAAQQPLRPLPKVGSCPIGFFSPATTASGAAEDRCQTLPCPAISSPPSKAELDALATEVRAEIAPMTMLCTTP